MPTQELSGTTALVTGASRGFGRAIAVALSKHGAHVAGVARDPARLEELHAQLGGTFTPVRRRPRGRARHQVHLGAAAAHSGTDLGAARVAACAARQGVDIPAFLDRLGPALTQPSRATPAASARPKLGP